MAFGEATCLSFSANGTTNGATGGPGLMISGPPDLLFSFTVWNTGFFPDGLTRLSGGQYTRPASSLLPIFIVIGWCRTLTACVMHYRIMLFL